MSAVQPSLRSALAASVLALAGCSSGNFEVAPSDAASSDTGVADAKDAAVLDATPEAAPPVVECVDPSSCGVAKPHCCATYDLADGKFPSCPASNIQTRCQLTCPTLFPLTCPASGRLMLCRNNNDCQTDPQNPKCCNVFMSGMGGFACISDAIASAGNLACK
jgi:hypothetical protein